MSGTDVTRIVQDTLPFLCIASILPILFKFSIDSCIAILFYSSYIAIQSSNTSSEHFEMMLFLTR